MNPPRILCPVLQRIPARKAHDKLVVRTAAALARGGAEVHLFAPAPLPDRAALEAHYLLPPALTLSVRPVSARPRFLYPWRLTRVMRAQDGVLYTSELKLARRLLELRLPLVYEAHTLHGAEGADGAEEAQVLARAAGVLATTRALADRLCARYGAPRRLQVVPLAAGWAEALARPPLIRGPGRRLGYVGQLYPLQGVDVLVEALALLPEHRLSILGGKTEEVEALRDRARALGVHERLELRGYVEPALLPPLIAELDVLLLPSRPAGRMPFVAHTKAFEYLAWARPIVSADLPSLREELGEAALFVEPESPAAWAAAIRRLDDESLARGLGQAGHARAQSLSWEARARAMLAFFLGLSG